MVEKEKKIDIKNKSSIFNKILISFFLVILLIGISINYFLQKYLQLSLAEAGIDKEIAKEIIISFVKTSTGVTLLFEIIAVVISFFISKSLIKPIQQLKKATSEISKGNWDYQIDIDSNDEAGDLANTFNQMKAELKDLKKIQEEHSQNLEKNVAEKTSELNIALDVMKDDKKKMNQQRLATLNILEDVSESQKNLEEAYSELERKNQVINSLKNVSQDLAGALDIEEAIHIATSHIEKNFNFYGITFLIYKNIESGLIYQNHLLKKTCEFCLGKARDDLEKYIKNNKKLYTKEAISIIQNVKPKHSGELIDNSIKATPKNFKYYSLSSGELTYGLVQIIGSEEMSLEKNEAELLAAIISAFSMSLDRLQTIVLAQQSKTVSLVESLRDGVIMFNTNEDLVIMNQSFTGYTGFSQEHFDLQNLYRLIPTYKIGDMVKASIKKGKISNINDVKLIEKYYEIIILPVRDNKEQIVGGAIIFHDITRLKEIDQMKTEFVSVASHQLRTPLTAIKLFTEMLVKGQVGKLKKEQKEYLENIYESTERMVRLVNDLLNVSRIESGRLRVDSQPLKILEFIEAIIAEAKPLVGLKQQEIKLVTKIDKTFEVPLDKNLIRQVFHNLIVNAIRYSPEKTGKIIISLSKDKDSFTVSVRDNGIGIPEEAQRRIFEKFFRAENAVISITEGTGLGLYVSKMIVESSNGKIWFESVKDKGATFFVKVPLKGMRTKKGERGLAIS